MYFSTETEIWKNPTTEIDLMSQPISNFDMQDILTSRDIFFRIPSDDEYIDKVCTIIERKFELFPLDDEREKVKLYHALRSAIGNAQRHGHNYNAEIPIEFRYIYEPDKLLMRVTDQGER